MRIAHLLYSDYRGGDFIAAERLNSSLRELGVESRLYVLHKHDPGSRASQIALSSGPSVRLGRAFRRFSIRLSLAGWRRSRVYGAESFDSDRSQYGAELVDALPDCDLVHLHHAGALVDYSVFLPRVTARMPLVWTLHDMNAFTGGCHYDRGCDRFMTGCGRCDQLASKRSWDLSARIWQRKRNAFQRVDAARLRLVTPSRWLAGEVRRSPIVQRFNVSVIPNSVDGHLYKPRDRGVAREVLGLPANRRILLFVAQQLVNPRKGFGVLMEALLRMPNRQDVCLLTVGIDVPRVKVPVMHIHLGRIEREGILSLAYNAADTLVHASVQDNLPNTILEAMACGIPVVAFETGGVPDMVRPNVTGLLCPVGDISALAESIDCVLRDGELAREFGRNCRRVATEEYTPAKQAEACRALYEELASAT